MTNNGLPYYLCDVNHDNGFLMVRSEFGDEGYVILFELMLSICRKEGYYCRWNEDDVMLFAGSCGKKPEKTAAVVNLAIEKGFFDKEMYEKYHILTSRDIQQKFLKAVKRRKSINVHEEYFLEELPEKFKNTSNTENVYDSDEDVYTDDENVCGFSTSKVKKSKVKVSEAKLLEDKEKKSKVCADAHSSFTDDGSFSSDDDYDSYTKTISLLKDYGIAVGPGTCRAVKEWVSEFNPDVIAYAVEQADARGRSNRGYIASILANLRIKKLDTMEKINRHEEAWRRRSSSAFSDKDSSVYKLGGTDYSDLERRMNERY
ncbi:MAG: DUF4373 domain-containing protein [bacterium]|nr:DUF4373 domain-containing protein [bacterium]